MPNVVHRRSRILRVLAIVAISLLGVIAGVTALVWVDTPLIAAQLREQLLPRLAEEIGRPIEVQTVRVRLFPVRGELAHVRVEGRPGEPPLAEIRRVRANLRLWALVSSRGHDVQLRSVELDGPRINLVRQRDGRWSIPGSRGGHGDRGDANQFVIAKLAVHDGALHMVGRESGKFSDTVALNHIELHARNVGSIEGMGLDLSGALASDRSNFEAELTATPDVDRWNWQGTIHIDSLEFARLHGVIPAGLERSITGGHLAVLASVSTLRDGAFELKGHVDARRLAMRGHPVMASTDFLMRTPTHAHREPILELSRIRLSGPGVDLDGQASMRGHDEIRFALAGPRLNIDALLTALPESKRGSTPQPPSTPDGNEVRTLSASGHLDIEQVTIGRLELEKLNADARLEHGVFTLTRAAAKLAGGNVDAAGSHADLGKAEPPWLIHAKLTHVDFARATQALVGAQPLVGALDANLDIHGVGTDWARLREGMGGTGSFKIGGGAWVATDLEQALAAPVRDALGGAGRGKSGAQSSDTSSKPTPVHGLAGSFRLAAGQLQFEQPLEVASSFGQVSLTGAVGLDQRLELAGTVQIRPSFVSSIAAFQPMKPIPAGIKVEGTISSPKVDVNEGDIARGLLRSTPPENLIRKGLHWLFSNHKS